MSWFDFMIAGVGVAALVRISAVVERTYWAVYQLLPAVAVGPALSDLSLYAEVLNSPVAVRRTAWRFGFALLPGAYLALRYDGISMVDPAAAGVLAFGLLVWPIAISGWPPVENRVALSALYAGCAAVFGALAGLAFIAVEAATSTGDGLGGLLADWAGQTILASSLLLVGSTVIAWTWPRIRPMLPWQ